MRVRSPHIKSNTRKTFGVIPCRDRIRIRILSIRTVYSIASAYFKNMYVSFENLTSNMSASDEMNRMLLFCACLYTLEHKH